MGFLLSAKAAEDEQERQEHRAEGTEGGELDGARPATSVLEHPEEGDADDRDARGIAEHFGRHLTDEEVEVLDRALSRILRAAREG